MRAISKFFAAFAVACLTGAAMSAGAVRTTVPPASAAGDSTPDELYRHRDDPASASRAADAWARDADVRFESAWKLSRVSYWIGTRQTGTSSARRAALKRGVAAGESAIRLDPSQPEGHFWAAANMGALAEASGLFQGLKYRGRVRRELERVLAIDPLWQEDSADAALGRWFFVVPRLAGGSRAQAESHLRRALEHFPDSKTALSFLADVLAADGRRDEARALLQRVLDSPIDPDWEPEDRELQQKAAARLQQLASR